MPTEVECAWTAGLIDADGCITLTSPGRSRGGRRSPLVAVDNTDHEILDELSRIWGGRIVAKRKYQEHHRQAWCWRQYGGHKIRAMLTVVRPHMHCAMKSERARLLLEEWPALTPRNGWYTDEMREAKAALEQRFMDLGAGRGKRSTAGHETVTI